MTATDSTHDVLLAQLQNELDEVRRIRAELEQYRDRTIGAPAAGDGPVLGQNEAPVSRRAALRTAGVVAAGALAGGAALLQSATPAAAYSSTGNYDATGTSTEPALRATASSTREAVIATSSAANLSAIRATATGEGAYGVWGNANSYASNAGVVGSSEIGKGVLGDSPYGIAVMGTSIDGPGGVFTTSSSVGISAFSQTGYGAQVTSTSADAILAQSTTGSAVRGYSSESAGGTFTGVVGVVGVGTAASGGVGGIGMICNGNRVSVRLTPSGAAPTGNIGWAYRAGDLHVDRDGALWYCVQDGTGAPSRWRRLAATSTAGSFNPITPARVYDSRRSIGAVTSGSVRTISVANSFDVVTGALVTSNIVPSGATAVAANITVTGTTGRNNFCVNPGGVTTVGSSMINWYANGQTAANAIIVAISSNRQINVVAGSQGGSAQVIVDVTGYWL